MQDTAGANKAAVLASAFLAVGLWGGTPAATRLATDVLDPTAVGVFRTALAAVPLLAIALFMGMPRPRDGSDWRLLALSGLCGFVAFPILFSLGVARTSTGHAALIIAMAPVITGFVGFFWQAAWPKAVWWGGAAIALVGEAMLIWERGLFGTGAEEATVAGDLLVALGTVCVAVGYVAGGRLSARIGAWPTTCWGVGLSGVALCVILGWWWDGIAMADIGAIGWGALFYLAIPSTVIGYAAWYWAMDKGGVAEVAPIQFAQPLVSLVIAALLFTEDITPAMAVATVTILGGVWLTRRA